jgi:hypothetical protein
MAFLQKLTLIFLICAFVCGAKERMPLPPRVMAAHKIFLDNRTSAKIGDAIYTELRKWGRFVITDSADKADLVFLVTSQQYIDEDSTYVGGSVVDSTSTENSLHISFLDPQTHNSLWSDTRPYATTIGATRLVRSLRDRVERQEKHK